MSWRKLVEDSARGRRLRQRAAALAALFLFLNGVVVAIGLGSLLPVLYGAAGLAGLIAALAWAIDRHRLWRHLPRARGEAAAGAARTFKTQAKPSATYVRPSRSNAAIRTQSVEEPRWPYAGSAEAAARPVLQVEHSADEPRHRQRAASGSMPSSR